MTTRSAKPDPCRSATAVLALLGAAAGCTGGEPPPAASRVGLPDGGVARVGGQLIHADTVRRIAEAQQVDLEEARDRAITDALFAAEARARLGRAPLPGHLRRAALARRLLETLRAEAQDRGPPTPEDVERLTRRRWWELDRPPLSRTVHAVVLSKDESDAARGLAERIRHAVEGAESRSAFEERARAVPPGALEVRVESLDPVAPDGRVVDPERPPLPGASSSSLVQEYAEAAQALEQAGDISPVVRSRFGYHVIFLVERLPERRLSAEQRRRLVAPEVHAERAAALEEELLTRLRQEHPVHVERAAMELTAKLRAEP